MDAGAGDAGQCWCYAADIPDDGAADVGIVAAHVVARAVVALMMLLCVC